MSTIWEMAAAIRDEEARGVNVRQLHRDPRNKPRVDIDEPGRIEYWCRHFGTTPMNLYCAIDVVGHEPTAVRRFLSRRGRPALATG